MDMNNVKAITLPDGSKVRKIKNNNGQIIWADDTKYPYRQLEWINFNGNQYCGIGSTWNLNKAYGINVIRDATDPNIGGILAGNNDSYEYGGWICNIQTNSRGLYFTYKAGNSTSPNYVLNDYLPNNSERTLWTYLSNNLIVLDVRDANGNVLGNDEFARSGGTWPGSKEVIIGTNLKGVKIKSLTIADATVSSGPTINVGTITSEILPCQRKSDGKLGFYIIPDNTFHPLSGTTTSANIGPTVDEYPDKMRNEATSPYRRLKYIESNGSAALDTQANCARNSFMRLTIEDMSNGASVQGNGRDNPNDNNNRFFVGYDGGNYWLGLGYSTKQAGTATPGPHTLELYGPDCQNGSGYKIDGTWTPWYPTFPSRANWYSVFLFANRSNATTGFNCQSKVRVYYAEYGYQNNNNGWEEGYNRKLVPVQRKSDGVLGFYDLQDNIFISDLVSGSSSSALSAGPTINEDWDFTI